MSPLTRVARRRAAALLGAMSAVVATWTVAAPAATADDMRSRQWYLDAMKADELWKVATGKGITVAVLDTGVDSTLPELRGKVLPGRNFDTGGLGRVDDKDRDRHGTNMALAIAGTGADGGVKGIAPGAGILPVKTGDYAFNGWKTMFQGIRYAVDNGARVINISSGGVADEAEAREWQSTVDYAVQKGALIFAASGNDGRERRNVYPASVPGVVAVGAVDTKGKVAKFSDYGSYVDLVAPGIEMPGRCPNDKNKFCGFWGTSHSAAIASGTAALIWSAHPEWTRNQVLRVMMETAGHTGPVPSPYIGYGSVRPAQVLLEGKGNPGDPDVDPLLAAQGAGKAPTPKPSNASQTSPSPENTGASGNGQAKDNNQAAESDEGGFPLWAIVASAVAVVALIGFGVVAGVRRRASTDA
ncbi:S8 family serine peptidase [Streptomyces sp. NPDC051909]|uniref:S8 family serine peptidase n=1 Tax=Streptomyces sp. NPDC051909 TaxID=3154944 RepID=UPI00341F0C40